MNDSNNENMIQNDFQSMGEPIPQLKKDDDMPINNVPTPSDLPHQDKPISNLTNDDELLKEFIGKNYEKITTRRFNIAAFFFNSLYMFYRKMFGYGILTYLIFLVLYFY